MSGVDLTGTGVRKGIPSAGEGLGTGVGWGLGSLGPVPGGGPSSSSPFGGLMEGTGGSGKSHGRGTLINESQRYEQGFQGMKHISPKPRA